MDAVGTVGRCFVFAAPDAHDTGATFRPGVRLLLQVLLDSRLPPRVGLRVGVGERLGERAPDLVGLWRKGVQIHSKRVRAAHSFG